MQLDLVATTALFLVSVAASSKKTFSFMFQVPGYLSGRSAITASYVGMIMFEHFCACDITRVNST
ncbi:hypothetical protein AFK24_17485 [Pseudomonas syringae]|uniref:Uncharacterized protein n=1 Tax=Pseudomonas syringae TaxID=317 RepID=A0A1C7Z0M4_PSESX|nr:hypothetical protein AFK24_17485 [Pseudomonas syringae]